MIIAINPTGIDIGDNGTSSVSVVISKVVVVVTVSVTVMVIGGTSYNATVILSKI